MLYLSKSLKNSGECSDDSYTAFITTSHNRHMILCLKIILLNNFKWYIFNSIIIMHVIFLILGFWAQINIQNCEIYYALWCILQLSKHETWYATFFNTYQLCAFIRGAENKFCACSIFFDPLGLWRHVSKCFGVMWTDIWFDVSQRFGQNVHTLAYGT